MDHGLIESLAATGPHPSLGAHADTYARIIGSWSGELSRYQDGKSVASASVEAHFGWALEGRAVQDVWITPARAQRASGADAGFNWYGSTLRVFHVSATHRARRSPSRRRHRANRHARRPPHPLDVLGHRTRLIHLAGPHSELRRRELGARSRNEISAREGMKAQRRTACSITWVYT